MGAWGAGGDNGARRYGTAAEGDHISGESLRSVSGVTSELSMQEREQRGVEYDERNRQRTTAGRRRLFLARKERHGAMNGHRQRTWAQPRHGFHE